MANGWTRRRAARRGWGTRRRRTAAALAALAMLAAAPVARGNPIQVENAKPGDTYWTFTEASARLIEGYASRASVPPGGRIRFYVRAAAGSRYQMQIHRLGWYGGKGGRRLGCIPTCASDKAGIPQPDPPAPDPLTGRVDAHWTTTETFVIPRDWVSGYYIAELLLTRGEQTGRSRFIPFIVRAPAGNRSAIVVQSPLFTWQAYNAWGGKSLYDHNSTYSLPAWNVSLNRPLLGRESAVFRWEYPLVQFLERNGYDVTYVTDLDTHLHPRSLLRHRAVLTVGHDEYWTKQIRDAFTGARDHGVSIAFLGANTGFWQVRWDPPDRTIVAYKWDAYRGNGDHDPNPDPALKTIQFRDLSPPRPECALMGVRFQDGGYNHGLDPEAYPLTDYSQAHDYRVTRAAPRDPWLRGTGLRAGSVIRRIVGYEWDTFVPKCVSPAPRRGPRVLFHYEGAVDADAVRYTAHSGARVFSAGTVSFAWALTHVRLAPASWGLYNYRAAPAADPRVQRFVRNMLADMTARRRTRS